MSKTDTTEPTPKVAGRKTKVTEQAEQLDLPPSKRLTPEKFWKYWRDCEDRFPDRTYCYVYRKWPVINRQQANPDQANSIDKCNYLDLKDFAAKWGNGDYNLILTDPYKAGPGHKKIVDVFASIREPDNPPVLDFRELVINDPANAEYIQQLRAKGTLLPGDEDMTSKESTAVLADTIKDLVSTRGPAQEQSNLTRGVVETMTTAAKASSDLLHSTFTQATQMHFKQPDPIETIEKVAGLVRTLQPQANSGVEMMPLFLTMMKESMAAQTAQFQAQLEAVRESSRLTRELLVRPAEPPAAPSTASRIQELLEEKMVESLMNPRSEKGSGTDWMRVAQFAFPALNTLVAGLVQASANIAGRRNDTEPRTQTQQTQQPTPQPTPQVPQPQPQPEEDMYQQFLNTVAAPLLNHLNQELTGADFADFIIQGYGRTIYDLVRQRGAEFLLAELAKHPQLGQYAAQLPERFQLFVEEFVKRDEIRAKEDAEA